MRSKLLIIITCAAIALGIGGLAAFRCLADRPRELRIEREVRIDDGQFLWCDFSPNGKKLAFVKFETTKKPMSGRGRLYEESWDLTTKLSRRRQISDPSSYSRVIWLTEDSLAVFDRAASSPTIRCLDVHSGVVFAKKGTAYDSVKLFSRCEDGKKLLVATHDNWNGLGGSLLLLDALAGESIAEIHKKTRDFNKISIANSALIATAVDDDDVCDIFFRKWRDERKVSFTRRRIDDLLFGKTRPAATKKGV